MRTRLALAIVASGAVLAALFTAPAFASAVTCSQAQFDVNQAVGVEQGTAAKVANAQSTLNNEQSDLQTDLNIVATNTDAATETVAQAQADIPVDQTNVAAYQQALTNAHNADNTALGNITAAEKIRDAACATTTPAPTTTTVSPPVGGTTIVRPPRNTTIVNPPPVTNTVIQPAPAAPNTVVIVPPAPVQSFGQVGTAPSGAINTGDGSLATGD